MKNTNGRRFSTRWRVAAFAAPALAALAGKYPAEVAADAHEVTFAFWGDPAEKRAYERLVEEFQAVNPDIGVRLLYTPGQADYRTQIATDFAAGDPPDVFLLNYRHLGQYAARGALEPLADRLAASEILQEEDFYPATLDAFRYRGETLYGIPQNASSVVIYYNQDRFDQAGVPRPQTGWTWDDFIAAAKATTIDTDGDGAPNMHGVGVEPSFIRYMPFIWMNGGDIVDNVDAPTKLTLDTPEALEAVTWFVGLGITEHDVVPTEAETLSEDDETRFMRGSLAMLIHSRRIVPTMREGIRDFAWDVAPLPVRSPGSELATLLHSDAFCLTADAGDKDAAWRFLEFSVGPVGQDILSRTGRTVPSLRSVAESDAFLGAGLDKLSSLGVSMPASGHVFLDAIAGVRRAPNVSTWPEVEDAFRVAFRRAFYVELDIPAALEVVAFRAAEAFQRAMDED
jgi:multiple sugar transport system substrate-binding protein